MLLTADAHASLVDAGARRDGIAGRAAAELVGRKDLPARVEARLDVHRGRDFLHVDPGEPRRPSRIAPAVGRHREDDLSVEEDFAESARTGSPPMEGLHSLAPGISEASRTATTPGARRTASRSTERRRPRVASAYPGATCRVPAGSRMSST